MPVDSYSIPRSDQEKLLTDGYVSLPDALPASLLKVWRDIADHLEENALKAHQQGTQLHGACVIQDPVGPRVMRYDDLLGVATDATLDLLSCPAMLEVFHTLCGGNAVPIQMDILYKHQHPHPVILWHQGAPHPRSYPYLNVGVYLDDAPEGDGCLRYVPGTQHKLEDISSLSQQYGWEIPGVIEQPAKAGDILVQDMMILHGSQPKRTQGCRRTIYIEIRPLEGIRESGVQSEEWSVLKKRWMAMVERRAINQGYMKPSQTIASDIQPPLGDDADEAKTIIEHREPPIPAVYSIHPVETEDYPVPKEFSVQ